MVRLLLLLLSALFIHPATAVAAVTYPNRPVTLVLPFPAGGATDNHLRSLAALASKHLGQTIIVENRPGASGSVALSALARTAQPDGYTLSVVVPTSMRLPLLQKMSYDPIKDLTYICKISGYVYVISVNADKPWRTWRELVNYARANPGKLTYGTSGDRSTGHLVMEQIARAEGISWVAVPFKGDAEITLSLLGGQIDIATSTFGVTSPHAAAGKVRMLAVWAKESLPEITSTPTLKQQGTNMAPETPYGIVGPARMDPAIVHTIAEAFRKASAEPANQARLRQLGQPDLFEGPEAFSKWARLQYDQEREQIQKMNRDK